jgi:hypothetical protein
MTVKSTKASRVPNTWDCVVTPHLVPEDRFARTARTARIRSLTSRPVPPRPAGAACM